jgi:hypothetical protein
LLIFINIYAARQPILDRSKNLFAYELLFRDSIDNVFPDIDGDVATSKMIEASQFNMGVSEFTGSKAAFINFTLETIEKGYPEMLTPDEVVVEILETVKPGKKLLALCKDLHAKGYTLALDDYEHQNVWAHFIPFIKIIKNKCYQKKLSIKEDYRMSQFNNNQRAYYPLNQTTNFKVNKYFRQITKNKLMKKRVLIVKGRKYSIKNYYEGISRFDFNDLCAKNIGAEDYIKIAEVCDFIIIENIPNFNNNNSNQQNRFITLIDILYEKNKPLLVTSKSELKLISSSKNFEDVFKRTISRLYELTSVKYN